MRSSVPGASIPCRCVRSLDRSGWGPFHNQALVDAMLGASWYRVLLEHAPLDDHFARELIRIVIEGNRPGGGT